jgi:hypothetical protein
MYNINVSKPIHTMKKDLLRGFCCEIQRTKQCTQFYTLHWSSEVFSFDQIGVELQPGNYTITVYSRGQAVMSTNINIRKIQTLLGIWVGGLNPKKPQGQSGIMIYKGDVKSLISRAESIAFSKKDDV